MQKLVSWRILAGRSMQLNENMHQSAYSKDTPQPPHHAQNVKGIIILLPNDPAKAKRLVCIHVYSGQKTVRSVQKNLKSVNLGS
jgi:hypothetical protein